MRGACLKEVQLTEQELMRAYIKTEASVEESNLSIDARVDELGDMQEQLIDSVASNAFDISTIGAKLDRLTEQVTLLCTEDMQKKNTTT